MDDKKQEQQNPKSEPVDEASDHDFMDTGVLHEKPKPAQDEK